MPQNQNHGGSGAWCLDPHGLPQALGGDREDPDFVMQAPGCDRERASVRGLRLQARHGEERGLTTDSLAVLLCCV